MRTFLLAALLVLFTQLGCAPAWGDERPHWALELKGGAFFPETAAWSAHYGESYFGAYGASLAYQVARQLEIGVEASYGRAEGRGEQPRHGQGAAGGAQQGEVTFQHLPLNLFVLGRLVTSGKQWLVPYAGGGYTRMFFRENVKGQGRVQGSVDGYHIRTGAELLLDRLEPDPAGALHQDFGVWHTYFFIEGRYTYAKARTVASGSVNIGGAGCFGGFGLEF